MSPVGVTASDGFISPNSSLELAAVTSDLLTFVATEVTFGSKPASSITASISTTFSAETGISGFISGSPTAFETVTVPTTIDGRATSVAIAVQTSIPSSSSIFYTPPAKRSTAHVVAGVVTSVVVLIILVLLLLLYYRRRKLSKKEGGQRMNGSLENVNITSGQGPAAGCSPSRRGAAPPMAAALHNTVVTPFLIDPPASAVPDTPAASTDMSHETSTQSAFRPLPNPNERSSEKGSLSAALMISNSTDNFPASFHSTLDEKHTPVPYVLQWTPSSPPSPATLNTGSSLSSHPHSPPPRSSSSPPPPPPSPPPLQRSLSFLLSNTRPTSTVAPSLAPSEAAPAYSAPNSASRRYFRYRSGASTLTTATESVPPAYEYEYGAEHAPPVPPLPAALLASAPRPGAGSEPHSSSASS